ncbi:MAG: class I SAM-dependent methyltransferase [Candidatus Eisenbacteria bacterium]
MNGREVRLPENAYDAFAELYDETRFDRFSLSLVPRIEELLPAGGGGSLADLACGTGSLIAALASKASLLAGVDRSVAMAKKARSKMEGARIAAGSLSRLPLRGSFDVVLCLYDSLNYLLGEEELRAAFAEAKRIAAPDGIYIFDTNDRDAYQSIWGSPEPFEAEGEGGKVVIRTAYSRAERTGRAEVAVTLGEGEKKTTYLSLHTQRYHPSETVKRLLASTGWTLLGVEAIEPFPGEAGLLPGGKTLRLARAPGRRGAGR